MRVWNFFILIVLGLGILYGGFNAGVYSYVYYKKFQQKWAFKKVQEEIKKQEEIQRQKLMADTYGGKTPQETLQMFIEAVEKGDYELASRYFIENKREEWKNELVEIKKVNKTEIFLKPLIIALNNETLNKNEISGKMYVIDEPVLIRFILYPNDIWKLTDI